jgi:hypothetical protein
VGLGSKASGSAMAARVQPARVRAAHQSMHHFVAKSEWSDNAILTAVHARVLPTIAQRGQIRALIIDDTATQRKASTPLVGRGSIAGNSVTRQLPGRGERRTPSRASLKGLVMHMPSLDWTHGRRLDLTIGTRCYPQDSTHPN